MSHQEYRQELLNKIEKGERYKALLQSEAFDGFIENCLNDIFNLWAGADMRDEKILLKCKYEFDYCKGLKAKANAIVEEGIEALRELKILNEEPLNE